MTKEPVKLGLYGCGNRTLGLLRSLEGEGDYEVASAYDLREAAAETLRQRFGGRVCRTADEMLEADGVDAVVISLNPFAHPEAFYKALEIGKPIFIEKPIAPTADEALRMTLAAREKGVPVQVGLTRRYYPAFQAVKRFLEERDPGFVFSMVYNWQHAGETEIINCRNLSPDNFRLKISQIPFHCCHALDLYHVFLGDVAAVEARGIKRLKRDYPSPDEVIALLEFKSGAVGHFHYSSVSQGWHAPCQLFINAENYSLSSNPSECVAYVRPPLRSMRGEMGNEDCRLTWNRNKGPISQKFDVDCLGHATAELMRDFLDSVRTGAPVKVPIEDGFWVAELAEAIETSWRERRRIELRSVDDLGNA